jgi:hypothetical protein
MSRLVCPRISPEWELAAQLALVKPKPYTKDKIAHRDPQQLWSRNARKTISDCLGRPGDKSPGLAGVTMEFPKSGDHRVILEFPEIEPVRAKRIARKLSRCLPELWFILDESIYLRDGVVYQRTGRYNLELVRADRMRLRRAVRFGFLQEVDHHAIPRPDHRARQDEAAQRDR